MDIEAALLTVAQIALGLAGFSSVLVALSGEPRNWTAVDAFRISSMLGASLSALLRSLVPFILGFLGLWMEVAWRASAALVALCIVGSVANVLWRFLRLPQVDPAVLHPKFVFGNGFALLLLAFVEIGAASGLVSRPEGVYFLGVVSLLAVAAFAIVRFLFARPAV